MPHLRRVVQPLANVGYAVWSHQLLLKRASASGPSGEWNDDDYDVLADGIVVGRIMKAKVVPVV
jgi:hypothetical protein